MRSIKGIRASVAGGLVASALILIGALPSLASAQDMDTRWLPWLGCWEASEGGTEIPMLCISPLPDRQGVELTTWSEGEAISTEAIYTDGELRDATREGCQGMEEAWFSEGGSRVYLKSQYICEGGVQRGATGLLAFANPMEWLDIKVVEVAGNQVPMVLRYRLARTARVETAGMINVVASRAMAVKTARIAASARLTPQDLIEANGQVDSKAVEALIVERGDWFDVNADMLVQLADANVSEEVINLAVAISFPEKFAIGTGMPEGVQTERAMSPMYAGGGYYGLHSRWSFWDPFYYNPFYYSPYGYSYSPYYYNYGGYSGYYRPTPIVVITDPNPGTGGYSHGRVINGRGYSRGGTSSSGGGSSSPSTRSAPSSRSGSSGVSSSGARRSSGGSSSSSGRTAKRRGGGGLF
jgi:uncharacterized membrane protein YgcG